MAVLPSGRWQGDLITEVAVRPGFTVLTNGTFSNSERG